MEASKSEISRWAHIAGIGPVTGKLIEKLKDGKPGDVLTDSEVESVCGKNPAPGKPGYANFDSARRYVLRHYGVKWKRVPKQRCVKCLNDDETLAWAERGRQRIYRASGREIAKLKTVDPANLADGRRTELFATLALVGALRQISSTETVKQLSSSEPKSLEHSQDVLRKTLKVFA